MLEIVNIELWTHRPPNSPSWKVTYKNGKETKHTYVHYPFAEDEMAAWVETLRWWQWKEETFRAATHSAGA